MLNLVELSQLRPVHIGTGPNHTIFLMEHERIQRQIESPLSPSTHQRRHHRSCWTWILRLFLEPLDQYPYADDEHPCGEYQRGPVGGSYAQQKRESRYVTNACLQSLAQLIRSIRHSDELLVRARYLLAGHAAATSSLGVCSASRGFKRANKSRDRAMRPVRSRLVAGVPP